MIQAQRGLNGFGIKRTDRQPACGARSKRRLEQGNFSICRILNSATRARGATQSSKLASLSQAKHKPKHGQQCRRNCTHLIHVLNLRPPALGFKQNLDCSVGAVRRFVRATGSTLQQIRKPPQILEGRRVGDPDYGYGALFSPSPPSPTGAGRVRWREWRVIQLAASQSRYFLFPAHNGRTRNSGVS